MDKDTESLGRYQKMVAELRAAGIRAEMYLGGAGMKAQIKYADRRGSPVAVIQGGDERAKGEVQIKDLIEGARHVGRDHRQRRMARSAAGAGDGGGGRLVGEVQQDPGGAGGGAERGDRGARLQRPPLACRHISPTRGEISAPLGLRHLSSVADWRKPARAADLPPCGGDVRQARGGSRPRVRGGYVA